MHGLDALTQAAARDALKAARGKKGETETLRRIEAALRPCVEQVARIGMDEAILTFRMDDPAVLPIVARRDALFPKSVEVK